MDEEVGDIGRGQKLVLRISVVLCKGGTIDDEIDVQRVERIRPNGR